MKKKSVTKPQTASGEPKADSIRLSQHDFVALLQCEHSLERAQSRLELLQHKHALSEANFKMMLAESQRLIALAIDAHKAAHKAQQDFVQVLQDRYHFSFRTHSYCPDTGVVRRVLED